MLHCYTGTAPDTMCHSFLNNKEVKLKGEIPGFASGFILHWIYQEVFIFSRFHRCL